MANDTRDRDFEDREAARNDEEADDAPVYTAEDARASAAAARVTIRCARDLIPSYAYGPRLLWTAARLAGRLSRRLRRRRPTGIAAAIQLVAQRRIAKQDSPSQSTGSFYLLLHPLELADDQDVGQRAHHGDAGDIDKAQAR